MQGVSHLRECDMVCVSRREFATARACRTGAWRHSFSVANRVCGMRGVSQRELATHPGGGRSFGFAARLHAQSLQSVLKRLVASTIQLIQAAGDQLQDSSALASSA